MKNLSLDSAILCLVSRVLCLSFQVYLIRQNPPHAWRKNILLNIQPKSDDQIDHQRRTKSDEGGIDKIQAYTRRIDSHPFSQLLTNTKSGFFQHMPIVIKQIFDIGQWAHRWEYLFLMQGVYSEVIKLQCFNEILVEKLFWGSYSTS